jgi:uncharacterized protein (TIGR03085 family)
VPWNPVERAALADALEAAGPRRPTLCEGWESRHLAAHVVLRESTALTAAGIVVKPLAERTERVTRSTGDRAADPAGYRALVDRVRSGPPVWHPLHWAGDVAQLVELFVHTEDVRRAGPDGRAVGPREQHPDHRAALWDGLVRMAKRLYARSGCQVVLLDDDGRRQVLAREGGEEVTVRGAVGELVLHAYGRAAVARVTVEGSPVGLTALQVRRGA